MPVLTVKASMLNTSLVNQDRDNIFSDEEENISEDHDYGNVVIKLDMAKACDKSLMGILVQSSQTIWI